MTELTNAWRSVPELSIRGSKNQVLQVWEHPRNSTSWALRRKVSRFRSHQLPWLSQPPLLHGGVTCSWAEGRRRGIMPRWQLVASKPLCPGQAECLLIMAGLHWHLSHGFSPAFLLSLPLGLCIALSTRQQLDAGPLSVLKGTAEFCKAPRVSRFLVSFSGSNHRREHHHLTQGAQTFAPSPLPVPEGTRALHRAPKALHDPVNIWAWDRGERQQRKPLQKPGWRSRIPEVPTNEVLAPTCLWRSAGPFLLLLALKNKTK